MGSFLYTPKKVGALLFVFIFSLYTFCLPLTVLGGDSGDFLTAIATHGIAHPSGYPLYTILGIVFSYLPFSATVAFKIGMLSAFLGSLSVVAIFLLILRQTKSLLIALSTSLCLAFVYPFWFYSETVEIFSLHYFFAVALFLSGYLYYKIGQQKYLLLVVFLMGLSLTNNLSIVLVFPSLLPFVFSKRTLRTLSPKFLLLVFLTVLLSLLPYTYLFYGSAHDTFLGWSRVYDIHSFLNFVLRQDYGWRVSVQEGLTLYDRIVALKTFAYYWAFNMPAFMIFITVIGIKPLFTHNRKLFLSSLLGVFFSGVFLFLYVSSTANEAFDLAVMERFYLVPYVFILPFFAQGLLTIQEFLYKKLFKKLNAEIIKTVFYIGMIIVVLFVPLLLFKKNYPRVYMRNVTLGEHFAQDLLSPVPKNSILLLKGDPSVFNTSYVHYVNHKREDVLLGTKGSVYTFVHTQPAYRKKLKEVSSAHSSLSANDAIILTLFEMNNTRQIFAQVRIGKGLIDIDKEWIPYGMLFELRRPGKIMTREIFLKQQKRIFSSFHTAEVRKMINAENFPFAMTEIPRVYENGFNQTADYLLRKYRDFDSARVYFLKALEMNPDSTTALEGVTTTYIHDNNCQSAKRYLSRLKKLDPKEASIYSLFVKKIKGCT